VRRFLSLDITGDWSRRGKYISTQMIVNPWVENFDWGEFSPPNVQCRHNINVVKTNDFYSSLPKISDNCSRGDCKYFEETVTNISNDLFKLLNQMGVNL
jgi:hypothetical protein